MEYYSEKDNNLYEREKEGFDPVCGSLHSLRHLGSFIADRCTNSPSLPLPPAVVGFLPLLPLALGFKSFSAKQKKTSTLMLVFYGNVER